MEITVHAHGPEHLVLADTRGRRHPVRPRDRSWPWPPSTVDVLYAGSALATIVGSRHLLAACARVLRFGGRIHGTIPPGSGRAETLASLLAVHGLTIEHWDEAPAGVLVTVGKTSSPEEDWALAPYFQVPDLPGALERTCHGYDLATAERRAYDEVRLMAPYLHPDMTVLDWGCGIGRVARVLARFVRQVVAVDLAHAMLRQAAGYLRDTPNVRLARWEPGVRVLAEPADFACTILVLQHLPPAAARDLLHRIADHCRPGAVILAQLPDLASYREPAYAGHTPERIFGDDFRTLAASRRPAERGHWHDLYFFISRV